MSMSEKFKSFVDYNVTDKELVNSWLFEIRCPDGIFCARDARVTRLVLTKQKNAILA